MRSGLLAKKAGMTSVYREDGAMLPVTVLALENARIIGKRDAAKHGYEAVVVGIGERKDKHTNKAQRVAYQKQGVETPRLAVEFRVPASQDYAVGAVFQADHFVAGQYIDVAGVTVGKGFAGVMKRHNFGGLRASHGVSISHRSHGSTGGRQDPGKVFKNKKMAGHMGQVRVTTQNLQVVAVDVENGYILVKGCVPGATNSYVELYDAVKKALPAEAPKNGSFVVAEAANQHAQHHTDVNEDAASVDAGQVEE